MYIKHLLKITMVDYYYRELYSLLTVYAILSLNKTRATRFKLVTTSIYLSKFRSVSRIYLYKHNFSHTLRIYVLEYNTEYYEVDICH